MAGPVKIQSHVDHAGMKEQGVSITAQPAE